VKKASPAKKAAKKDSDSSDSDLDSDSSSSCVSAKSAEKGTKRTADEAEVAAEPATDSWGQPKGGKKGGKDGKKGAKGGKKGGKKGEPTPWLSEEDFYAAKQRRECFVTCVPETCNDEDVKTAFGADSWVERCKWLNKEGWSGKGFITFADEESAQAAAAKETFEINSETCYIEWSGAHARGTPAKGGDKGGKKGGKDSKGGKKGGKDGGKKGGKKGGKDGPPSNNHTSFDMDAVGKNKETFADSDSD